MHIDALMESFNLNILGEPHGELDPDMFFNESADMNEIREMYTEATTGATKGNMVGKLFALIKKIWKWICDRFRQLVNFISRLINRKSKTVDQIMEENNLATRGGGTGSVVSSIKSAKSAEQIGSVVSSIASQYGGTAESPKSKASLGKISSVQIPSNPKSSVAPPNVDIVFKSLITKIEANGSITFKLADVINEFGGWGWFGPATDPKVTVPGKFGPGSPAWIFGIIANPSVLDKFGECADYIANNVDLKNAINGTKFVAAVDTFVKLIDKATSNVPTTYTATFAQLNECSRKLNEIGAKMDRMSTSPEIGDTYPGVVDRINILSNMLASIQMAMNLVTGAMHGIYQVDGSYIESIDTMEGLDTFVDLCLQNGVPTKYIAWNLYMVASKELKGKADKNHPIWGQSRVAFIPTNGNVVHKFALSEWGRQSIKAENMMSQQFAKYGQQNLIASVVKLYPKACAVDMEKVDTNKRSTERDREQVANAINKFLTDHNITVKVEDVAGNDGNVGWKPSGWCCIDYGFSNRSLPKMRQSAKSSWSF